MLREWCQRHEEPFGVSMSHNALERGLKRLGLSFITRGKRAPASKRYGRRIGRKRAEIAEEVLIFMDERGKRLDLTGLFGRAPRNESAYGEELTGAGGWISTIGALSLRGLKTALCFEGTLNGAVFLFLLKHFLCPRLQPSQWGVKENARAHQVIGVRTLIE